ncbi:hypothetical protein DV738_g1494, partial [Chaetothyriales sp. CBS 135597]
MEQTVVSIPSYYLTEPPLIDDLTTKTSELQQDTIDECLPLLQAALDASQDPNDFNASGVPELRKSDHIAFLEDSLATFPARFVGLDASRPWMVYWALLGLHLLGEDVSQQRQRVRKTFYPLQNSTGGFGGGYGHYSHLAGTYAALLSIALVGGEDTYAMIDRKAMWHWLGILKQSDGGFQICQGGEEDVRGALCALVIVSLLDLPLELPPDAPARSAGLSTFGDGLADFIARCQTYEGGISASPGLEAHSAYAFCAIASLCLLGDPNATLAEHLDIPALLAWLSSRQYAPEGGSPDSYHTCYTLTGLSNTEHFHYYREGEIESQFASAFSWQAVKSSTLSMDRFEDGTDLPPLHPVFVIPHACALDIRSLSSGAFWLRFYNQRDAQLEVTAWRSMSNHFAIVQTLVSEPRYFVTRGSNGYKCTVRVNNREYQTPRTQQTESTAREEAALIAFNICRSFSANDGMYPTGFAHDGVIQGNPVPVGSGRHTTRHHASRQDSRGSNSSLDQSEYAYTSDSTGSRSGGSSPDYTSPAAGPDTDVNVNPVNLSSHTPHAAWLCETNSLLLRRGNALFLTISHVRMVSNPAGLKPCFASFLPRDPQRRSLLPSILRRHYGLAARTAAHELNQQSVDDQLADGDDVQSFAEQQDKQQKKRPWHREGADEPPVCERRSAAATAKATAITKGKIVTTPSRLLKLVIPLTAVVNRDSHQHQHQDIAPLALLIHPQQPLSYLERLLQAELPTITNEKGDSRVPSVTFRAIEASDSEIGADSKDDYDDDPSSQSYTRDGHVGNGKGQFVKWSASTELGDFIRVAARANEFEIEIEGAPDAIKVAVPSFNDRTFYLRLRLRRISGKISDMAKIKQECDEAAYKTARTIAVSGGGVLIAYWYLVYRLTFETDLGWDAVEPCTYLVGLSTFIGGYLWFLWNNREVSYEQALKLTMNRRQSRMYELKGFDVRKWEASLEEANAIRREIMTVASEYDVEWDERLDEGDEAVTKALRDERQKHGWSDKKKKKSQDEDEDGRQDDN